MLRTRRIGRSVAAAFVALASIGVGACSGTSGEAGLPELAIFSVHTPGISTPGDWWATVIVIEEGFDAEPLAILCEHDVESMETFYESAVLEITLTEEGFTKLDSAGRQVSHLVFRLTSAKRVMWGPVFFGFSPPAGPVTDAIVVRDGPRRLSINSLPRESQDSLVQILSAGWS